MIVCATARPQVLITCCARGVPWALAPHADGLTKLVELKCASALLALFEGRHEFSVHARVLSHLDVASLRFILARRYTECVRARARVRACVSARLCV